jgi:hypothetical protein
MKKLFTITLIAGIMSANLLAADGEKPPKAYDGGSKHVIDRNAPDLTNTGKHREWRMWYIFKGTRSEGLHGELVINGRIRTGTKVGEKFESDGGTLIWHGPWDDRKQLFSKSGWLPEDLSAVCPSWNRKAEQDGSGQPATRPESKSEGGDKPQPEAEGRSL